MELEDAALCDDYFVERKLYPNVDFYSGIIYQAMGIPVNMFTVFFALGRMPGWISQWMEHLAQPKAKIGRPRQIYTGPNGRDHGPSAKRSCSRRQCRGEWDTPGQQRPRAPSLRRVWVDTFKHPVCSDLDRIP